MSITSLDYSDVISTSTSFIDILRARASEQAERTAYILLNAGETEEGVLTFGELDRQARAIAALLQANDAEGERVLLLFAPGLEYIAAFFGCLYAGAVAVPAYPPRLNQSIQRLETIVADSQASIVLTTQQLLSRIQLSFSAVAGLKKLRWLASEDALKDLADAWREPKIDQRTLAFLQYTSGSTATPKGVMVTHANLLHNERMIQLAFGQSERSIIVGWLPLYHDMGLIGTVLQPLYLGAQCILMPPMAFLQRPFRWLQAITRYRATTSGAPNFAYDLCVRKITDEQKAQLDLTSWTVAFNGAEPVRAETLEHFAAAFESCGFRREAFHPCYGLAESTLLVSGGGRAERPHVKLIDARELESNRISACVESDQAKALIGCGSTAMGQTVTIINPESLTHCSAGEVGEIWVSGESVAAGYWNRPEETAQTFAAYQADTGHGPFLRTGDLGFLSEGELFVTGRLKDLLIIRGRNLYPQDIEATVARCHPALRLGGGAAFSVDVAGEERLVIVHEVNQRIALEPDVVAAQMRQAVSESYEVQLYAVVLIKSGTLPKTSSGKIQRHACRAAYLRRELQVVSHWNETTARRNFDDTVSADLLLSAATINDWLVSQLAARLRIDATQIDVKQPITRYGVDSLLAVELSHEIETSLGVVLSPVTLLHSVSISQLVSTVLAQLESPSVAPQPFHFPPAPAVAESRLSHGQRALWFMQQLAPDSAAYSITSAVSIFGPLNIAAFRLALQSLVDSHPALRSTFKTIDGQPAQLVHEHSEIAFEQCDASDWNETELRARLNAESQRPFDLEQGPLLRIVLYECSNHEHIVLLSAHHIVTDFWSLGIFLHELSLAYQSAKSGKKLSCASAGSEYADFVQWQTQMLQSSVGEELEEYWKKQLDGQLSVLRLPTDRPRPLVQTYRGASENIRLDTGLTRSLKELSEQHQSTLFMTLLAAFKTLLFRYTGQEDVIVGTTASGRSQARFAGVMGYFVNPVVLRTNFSGDPQFTKLLADVRQTVLGALQHQDYPFPLLVERLQPERDPGYSPLFNVACVLQNSHLIDRNLAALTTGEAGIQIDLGSLTLQTLALEQQVAQFDLTLVMAEVDGQLAAFLQYNTDLFDHATISRMIHHFQQLLQGIVEHPDRQISQLPLLTEREREQQLAQWNETAIDYARDLTIPQLFEAQAAATPEAVALICADERLTYGELNERANCLAHYLQESGVTTETIVGVFMERSVEMIVAMLGVLKAGGAYVPLDPQYPHERLAFMLQDAGIGLLLTQSELAAGLSELAMDHTRVMEIDREWRTISDGSSENPTLSSSPDNLAYIIYTSGSTGTPKGVAVTHRGLSNLVHWHCDAYQLTPQDRGSLVAGIGFDASVWELWPYLACGASLVVVSGERVMSPDLLAWLAGQGVTVCFLPTPLAEAALWEMREQRSERNSLRVVLTGGDRLRQRLAAGLGFALVNHYGPTECTVVATSGAVECGGEEASAPAIGRPISNTQVYVLGAAMELAPVGVTGELYLGGERLARGYWNRPEQTAERFIPHPFSTEPGARLYRTGDLVRYLPDGNLEFIGRADEQVKVRGFRIELGEIESVLGTHAAVREVVVIASEDAAGNKQLVAYVVSDESIDSNQLRAYLKGRLPEYMVPSAFVTLEEMPLTPNGKVDRKALPKPERSGGDAYVAARTPVEEVLVGIWEQLLKLERVGVHENFFELGGHSLLATQVNSRIRLTFHVDLPLHVIFEFPTIAELATRIDAVMHGTVATPIVETSPLEPASREQVLPLSFAQQRLWFLNQLESDSAFYNMLGVTHLRGALEIDVLERSLSEVVRRHEVLRTTFRVIDDQPVQLIAPASPLTMPLFDFSQLDTESRRDRVQELIAEEAARQFDLANGPIMQATLLRLAEDHHIVLFSTHHIVCDGWSVGVLVKEVAALYEAFSRGGVSPLPELRIQYADFAVWQREWLRGEALEQQLSYWRKQLNGAPPVLELPTDRPRPAVQSYRGASHSFHVSTEVSGGLKALSRSEGATLFMTLLAAFKVLLSRYSGQTDIVVGTPIAGRNRVELEPLIGFFVNTLVLRTQVSPAAKFSQLLKLVREVCLGAYAHQEAPFEKLVEELQPERDMSRGPLFQVMFILQNMPEVAATLNELEMRVEAIPETAAKFDLSLEMVETNTRLEGEIKYNTDLFDAATIERMSQHFQQLLQGIVAQPEAEVSQLPLLTAAEIEQQLVQWNDSGVEYPRNLTLHQLCEAQAVATPEAIAVVYEDEQLTYRQLNERANDLAEQLRQFGVGPDTVVAVCFERSLNLVVSLFAILKAGGAYLPLDPAYPRERLRFMLEDARARVLLTQPELLSILPETEAEVLFVDERGQATLPDLFITRTSPKRTSQEEGLAPTPENLAYIIYTSGSTGTPKGAMVTHGGVLNCLQWMQQRYELTAQDRFLMHTSLSFDPSVWEVFWPLTVGGRVVIAPAGMLESSALLSYMTAHSVSCAYFVPSQLGVLVQEQRLSECRSLRYVISGGEKLPLGVMREFQELSRAGLHHSYGPTETSIAATEWTCEAGAQRVLIGSPLGNTQVYVLDRHIKPLPVGVAGELYIGGVGVGRGYKGRADLTAERFVPHPFSSEPGARLYRTGDLVRYGAGGEIEYVGRVDHQVKVRGFRIELGEIESVLDTHAAVREVVVIASEQAVGDTRLVAYVVLDQAAEAVSSNELREYLKQRLPEYMAPSAFVTLAEMPLTPNGKVDRKALPAPKWVSDQGELGYVAPRTPVEEVLSGIWKQVLRVERVGVHENFFELGGHSLLATQVISRIREAFRVELPLRVMFESQSIASLAARISDAKDSGDFKSLPLYPISHDRELPLSFAQQRLWVLGQLEEESAVYHMATGVRLHGVLDVPAFKQTLNEIVRRHESLRTTFVAVNGRPAQLIAQPAPVDIPIIDLSTRTLTEREAEAAHLSFVEARRPLDLARGPLLRATLLRLDIEEHLLLFTIHHAVSDGWSMNVLAREMSALYEAFSTDRPSPLAELSIQYADFAYWQREWLSGKALEPQLAYWKKQLAGELPILELPADRPRTAVQSFCGATYFRNFSAEMAREIKAIGKQEDATLFITLVAAFAVMLNRYSDQDDILIGSPVAGRDRLEIESLIGFFVNTLVLRFNLSGNPSFRELLRQSRELTLAAQTHQDLPFEMLVEALQPERSLGHSPIFQVMFTLQSGGETKLALPGLRSEPYHVDTGTARFELTLAMVETSDGLEAYFEYNSDRFDENTVERMADHFETLLQGIIANPDKSVSELPLLTRAEQRQLTRWNHTSVEYPSQLTLNELFEAQVNRTPRATALVYQDERLSYAELNERANRLGHYLRAQGIGPETLVGILLERSPLMIVGMLGVLKAGAAYVPLDINYPRERLQYTLQDSRAQVLLTQAAWLDQLPEHEAQVVCLDQQWPEIARQPANNPELSATETALAYVIYTSGSTGRPKGVAIEHRSAVAFIHWAKEVFSAEHLASVLFSTSICFDLSIFEIFVPLSVGGKIIIAAQALELPMLPAGGEVTLINTVPSAMTELVRLHAVPNSVRVVNLAGEPLQNALAQSIYQQAGVEQVLNLYGPSESTTYSTWAPVENGSTKAPSIGRPIANTQAYVLDAQLQLVPVGVVGELYLGGFGLARGYLNLPELTAERFIPDGFSTEPGGRLYRTGDLARFLPDGRLEFLGRRDHQVKVRGFRIELGEIEAVLKESGKVQDVVVIAREDMRLVAYVTGCADDPSVTKELRDHLGQKLPEYMVPSAFVMLTELPLTPNGKVDRKALPEPGQSASEVEYVAPSTPIEEVLCEMWEQVLKLDRVGVHDNFFQLGGHSLLATQVISQVREIFDVELPLRRLFETPTVATLAAVIEMRQLEQADTEKLTELLAELDALSEDGAELIVAQEK
jgi:amino acid adenylation domain-containing protein